MSDDNLNDPPVTDGDARLLDLVDRLGPEAETAERHDLETLGALPWALDDLPVAAGVKHELMASIRETGASREELAAASGRLATLERRTRWYLPIAAGLALAFLGLAGFQFRQLEGQQRTIERLSSQLGRVERDGVQLAEARRLLAEKGRQMRMMTTRGAEFCLLKPVGDRPRYPGATATMVIAPDRRQWFLAAEGLEPCPAATCYRLWFITEAESIPAASFDCRGGEGRIELSGTHEGVPDGVRAITITRDHGPEATEPPETVLLADQAMTLL